MLQANPDPGTKSIKFGYNNNGCTSIKTEL